MELHHDCIIGNAVYSAYRKFWIPKLFRMADQGRWDEIPARVRKCPKEAFFVHKYAPCDNALHRLLRPIHIPCPSSFDNDTTFELYKNSTDVPTEDEVVEAQERKRRVVDDPMIGEMLLKAVAAIIKANTDAAITANMFGRTPLHLACIEINSYRSQAAEYLIEHMPMTTSVADHSGYTALHFLMDNHPSDIPEKLIRRYLEADPEALTRRNMNGQTPLDIYHQSVRGKGNNPQESLIQKILNASN
ncbi:hypothetical protein ACA910_014112 [Epithemia clementina (nom. ined.)]